MSCYTISMATPISPNTSVYLLKCPLELDNQHQLNFASRQAQHNYFMSLPKIEFDNFSYQRQDGVLRIGEHIDNIIDYNYVMYQNENYTNRWFYAYITGMEYVNDNCTFVSIKTDVIQTWFPDLTFKRCFVEREHVNDDTFGLHTLEENIPSGEWFNNGTEQIGISDPKQYFVGILFSDMPDSFRQYANKVRIYNGIPNGCYFVMIDLYREGTPSVYSYGNLNEFLKYFADDGKSEAIQTMYVVPKSLMGTQGTDYREFSFNLDGYSFDGFVPEPSIGTKLVSTTNISRNTTLNGYTPKNNKCFSKQFNYLMAINNAGASVTYNWEDFNGNPQFKLLATYAQGIPTKLVPTNYKGNDEPSGNAYALTGASFPIVSWVSDYYLNWQAKNGWNGAMKQAGKLMNFQYESGKDNPIEKMGEFLGTVGSYVGAEISAIGNTISGSMGQAERVPDSVSGDPTNGDFTFSVNKCKFTLYKMSVRYEVAKIVDDYFSAYGYKVSTWKVPNFTGRSNWNFVKLNQVNVTADIPQTDLDEIKKILLAGVTFWHNPTTFLDYSQNNPIV